MKRRIKINGFLIFVSVLLIAFFPSCFLRQPSAGFADEAMEIFGIAFILLGQIFRVSARGFKSEHSQEGNLLIQDGPYALVRNPMYLGILFIGLGIVLMLFNWWVACVFLLIFVARYIPLMFAEEEKLKVLFPGTYLSYQRRIPRLMPSASTLLKKDISEYLPLRLSWLEKEIGSITAVLLATLVVESWVDIKSAGLRTYLRESMPLVMTIILFVAAAVYLDKRTKRGAKDAST